MAKTARMVRMANSTGIAATVGNGDIAYSNVPRRMRTCSRKARAREEKEAGNSCGTMPIPDGSWSAQGWSQGGPAYKGKTKGKGQLYWFDVPSPEGQGSEWQGGSSPPLCMLSDACCGATQAHGVHGIFNLPTDKHVEHVGVWRQQNGEWTEGQRF
eukprot:1209936-Amphidinium_carterae.1